MPQLTEEQATFQEREAELKREHSGAWVVISGREVAGVFESFQNAADMAVKRFQKSSFLIRQIDGPPPRLSRVA
jgi:hypothetical protein